MMNLVMALHCHQPVGNFDHVFELAHEKCYRPLLDILAAHPAIALGIHFSGPLLEWLEEHQPETLDLLASLVRKGQAEPMSGGFYEPLLAAIPGRDAVGQVEMMNDYIQKRFGFQPTGFWLTERIWDPSLPLILAGTGMEYTIVDDTHFHYAGLGPDDIFGRYVTEKEGWTLSLLATPMVMRYMIPFKPVEEVMGQLKAWDEAGRGPAVYGDDGEKFGLWPGTHEWVIQKGWLDRFFTAVEESADWLRAVTPGGYIAASQPQGRLYLPQASYEEMTEWALPPAQGQALEDMTATLKAEGRWESWRHFVRGGVWDNFLVKYDESNRMHKKMILLSGQAGGNSKARQFIWRAQCNCAYWHGVFGGLYLGHLRRAIHENLIRAQAELNRTQGDRVSLYRLDYDKDGQDEILLTGPGLSLGLAPDRGGGIFEICHMGRILNLSDILTRRPEAYHHRLQALAEGQARDQEVASIHDQVKVKEEGLDKFLVYDPYTRLSLLDHFLESEIKPEDLAAGRFRELGDFVQARYNIVQAEALEKEALVELTRAGRVDGRALSLTKSIRLGQGALISVVYEFECA
ncbi:MAG: alpha-amylase/4-alpha-glucanotransferase domain-containing protein, partial [Thermodesulfobacteriota bacterium]|nr:alpha-amylase/4-alpha-glucanotransferase domain-containing protein [Thermodesulfobacteriota bacterium]